jgi:uncharacterized damage-inducible protein DinB
MTNDVKNPNQNINNNRNKNNRYKKNQPQNKNGQVEATEKGVSEKPKNQGNTNNQKDSSSNNRPNQNRNFQNNRNQQNRNFRQNKESIVKKLNDKIDLNRENFILITKFNKSLQKMVSYADPCSEEQLLWKQSYDSWDIKEILGHIIQCNKLYLKRLEHILSDDESEIVLFDQNKEIKNEEFDNHSLETLLKQLILSRKDIEIFCLNTSDEDWDESRVHPEKGKQTFRDIVAFISEHDEIHMKQMFMNMQRFKPWLVEEEKKESPESRDSLVESSEDSTNTATPIENLDSENISKETEEVDTNSDKAI